MRNLKLTIEYDGSSYCGWQVQPNGATVQAVLEGAIKKMTGQKTNLTGASRTDSGVHALGQTANFKTASTIPAEGFLRGLTSMLPPGIVIRSAEEMPVEFHSKRNSKRKHYRYLVLYGKTRPAVLKDYLWFVQTNGRLNIRLMNKAAQVLAGAHDFGAFCASDDCNKSKIRWIDKIAVSKIKDNIFGNENIIACDIIGNGFLKHMVRNIVGTLVGLCKRAANTAAAEKKMRHILESRDRKKAGVTAPASGLFLMSVKY